MLFGLVLVCTWFMSTDSTFPSGIMEGFHGDYPMADEKVLLDSFPQIGENKTSNNSYSSVWWKYPVFPMGSYKQLTNNLKHYRNPDNGTCRPADFCGALYRDRHTKSNEIHPLPPAEEGEGARVGYFRANVNWLPFSIPTNKNILY